MGVVVCWDARRGLAVGSWLVVASLLVACGGGDSPSRVDGGGGDGGGDGSATDGGMRADGSGGRDGSSGDSGAGCVSTSPPLIPPESLPACPMCTDGHCLPSGIVPEALRPQLADCDTGNKCVPDIFIRTSGQFLLPTCRSVNDAEGRCLSTCVPAVAAQIDLLPQASCTTSERCVPCYDPTTGMATGACGLSCDTGPAEPASMFPACCGGDGACVPRALVPADQASQLGRDTCTDADSLCAPRALAGGTSHPTTCRSIANAEGRCLPSCLPAIAAQASRLPMSSCPANQLCAPCFDPLSGADSGACRLNGDVPAEPPVRFDRCCEGMGSCIPRSLVPPADASQLGRDTCAASDSLCAPDELQGATFVPPACRSIADTEGRCLPSCLPAIAAQASQLPQSSCAAGHLCAPCYDPITGSASGACGLHGDMPTEPAYVFPGCCTYGGTDRGRCVPMEIVPPDQASSLPQDDCSSADLCVPTPFLSDPSYHFPSCVTGGLVGGGSPGACVPDCIVGFFEGLFLTQSTCDDGELCGPCINPLTGADSGACG